MASKCIIWLPCEIFSYPLSSTFSSVPSSFKTSSGAFLPSLHRVNFLQNMSFQLLTQLSLSCVFAAWVHACNCGLGESLQIEKGSTNFLFMQIQLWRCTLIGMCLWGEWPYLFTNIFLYLNQRVCVCDFH